MDNKCYYKAIIQNVYGENIVAQIYALNKNEAEHIIIGTQWEGVEVIELDGPLPKWYVEATFIRLY